MSPGWAFRSIILLALSSGDSSAFQCLVCDPDTMRPEECERRQLVGELDNCQIGATAATGPDVCVTIYGKFFKSKYVPEEDADKAVEIPDRTYFRGCGVYKDIKKEMAESPVLQLNVAGSNCSLLAERTHKTSLSQYDNYKNGIICMCAQGSCHMELPQKLRDELSRKTNSKSPNDDKSGNFPPIPGGDQKQDKDKKKPAGDTLNDKKKDSNKDNDPSLLTDDINNDKKEDDLVPKTPTVTTPTNMTAHDDHDGLTTGHIVAIVLGAIGGLALVCGAAFLLFNKRADKAARESSVSGMTSVTQTSKATPAG